MLHDVRHALRALAKRPSSAILTVIVFAVAIGANATVFSVFNGFFLRPLPFPGGDRLVKVGVSLPKLGLYEGVGNSIPGYLEWLAQASLIEGAALYLPRSRTLRSADLPEQIDVARASPSLLAVLGVAAAMGRGFTDDEAPPGSERVIVLSHRLWATVSALRGHRRDVRLNDDRRRDARTFRLPGSRRRSVGAAFLHGAGDGRTSAEGIARLRDGATQAAGRLARRRRRRWQKPLLPSVHPFPHWRWRSHGAADTLQPSTKALLGIGASGKGAILAAAGVQFTAATNSNG